ncbi:MAG TPA: BON domain-containing protein [Flavobacterium sp.]|nr:BON domain-containing protein [Flavobacterium sp.]
MKSNEELQKDIIDAINWEPLLHAATIGVAVENGVVTLTGAVNSFSKKAEARQAAQDVSGVKTVIEKIDVVFDAKSQKTDNEIETEIINAFKWHWDIPNENVNVKVASGLVTLSGQLEWNYQKEAAQKTVSNLIGVKGISNDIRIVSLSKDGIEKKDIEDAIIRNGHIDSTSIEIEVINNLVTLRGSVDSWYQKSEAGRIAWNAPGVKQVQNDLYVDFEE